MAFDWKTFLTRNRIDFQVRRNELDIRCPFCGEADPSMHLSISLRGRGWRCFRNPAQHAGRNRARLIQALLRCTWEEACEQAGFEAAPSVPEDSFIDRLAAMLGMQQQPQALARPQPLVLPSEFRPLLTNSVRADPFWDYLHGRGFGAAEIEWLAETYQLHYATSGYWRYRLIIPVQDARRRLISWTGRSILPDAALRYLTLSVNPRDGYDGPLALAPPGNLLLGLPYLMECDNPRVLVLCEGPFDAMRLSVAGARYGVAATCLFGLNVSEAQLTLLLDLCKRFRRVRLLLDEDAQLVLLRLLQPLSVFRVSSARLPPGVKDPGDLPAKLADEIVRELAA